MKLQTYSAVLEAEIELPSHLKTDRLSVRLLGEACVPEVILIEPSARTKRDRIILSFNRILVGETGVRKLAFQNIGFLEAKVIVEVCNDPNFLFSLEPFNDSTRLAHIFDSDGEGNNQIKIKNIKVFLANLNARATFSCSTLAYRLFLGKREPIS